MIKYEVGQTYHVPPGTLLLERNIREAKPDPDLVASIAALGVLEPVGAVLTDSGGLLVRSGHRRTLSAIEAKLKTVPVYVRGTDELDDSAEVLRVIQQRDENTHRAGLSTAEEIGVVEQLAAFGLEAEDIVEQARIGQERVATARRILGSKTATKAAAKWEELDLEQVATIAEFEDDKDAITKLMKAAREGHFEHTAQELRDDRDEAARKVACIEGILAEGIQALDGHPGYQGKARQLGELVDVATGKEITKASHADCPGAVGWPTFFWNANERDYRPTYGCADPRKHGHRDRYSTRGPAAADMSDEAREKAKVQRRLVVDNNKSWVSATVVRRKWILEKIVAATSAPKTAPAFIAIAVSTDANVIASDYKFEPDKLVREWLKLKGNAGGRANLSPALNAKGDARCLVIALVYVIASYEIHAMEKDAWRYDGTTNKTGRYLRFLQDAGYPLSDVEKYAASRKTLR